MKRSIAVSLLALGLGPALASAQNLVPNGDFATDLAGWGAGGNDSIVWQADDLRSSAASGSVLLSGDHPGTISLFSGCIPATAGRTYVFGANARVREGQGLPAFTVRARVRFWNTTTCSSLLESVDPDLPHTVAGDSWGPTQGTAVAPTGTRGATVLIWFSSGNAVNGVEASIDEVFLFEDATCAETPTTLCLEDERFRVSTVWEKPDGSRGNGRAVGLTDDSGFFYFFNPANIELVNKILDACPTAFDSFWVFAAGLTNVGVTLSVRDTVRQVTQDYVNPVGQKFEAIQDTAAFLTCP